MFKIYPKKPTTRKTMKNNIRGLNTVLCPLSAAVAVLLGFFAFFGSTASAQPFYFWNQINTGQSTLYYCFQVPSPQINANQVWYSPSWEYILMMQPDCNLVLYDTRTPALPALWASNTSASNWQGSTPWCIFQRDGNLVLYVTYQGFTRAYWASNTYLEAPDWLAIQNDGNVVIYAQILINDPTGAYNIYTPIWSTGTAR